MATRSVNLTSEWTIIRGPSREELFDALRLRDEHRRVEFELVPTGFQDWEKERVKGRAEVSAIHAEDGSGHCWVLKLYFISDPETEFSDSLPRVIYYSDTRRHGRVMPFRFELV